MRSHRVDVSATRSTPPVMTVLCMVLSLAAAFVLPYFATDPSGGAKPLQFMVPTIALGLMGAVFAIPGRRWGWVVASALWGFMARAIVFAVAVLVEWATGGPHV